jgi:putative ABC transport system substrate-binding protein
VSEPGELDSALMIAIRGQPDALVLPADTMINNERDRIAKFALDHQLPSISGYAEFAEAGGLVAYGPSLSDIWRSSAGFIDKILRGSKPGDLPVEQPTKFELVINLKTARALGLVIPQSTLLRADNLIE